MKDECIEKLDSKEITDEEFVDYYFYEDHYECGCCKCCGCDCWMEDEGVEMV